jgi:zinc protease
MVPLLIENNTVYYEHDSRTPVTKLTIVFVGAGEQKESAETIGLAGVTAKLLFRGTSLYSLDELQAKFDFLGATISAYTSETDFIIKLSVLSRNFSETCLLLKHVLNEVTFSDEQIRLVKKQEHNRLDSLLQSNDEVLRIANKYFLYDKSFRGKSGSKSSLETLARAQIVEYFNNVRSAHVVYFSVVSDLSELAVKNTLAVLTKERASSGFLLNSETEYRTARGREAFIVDLPNAPNDRLIWSHKGIDACDPRRFALSLILDALGSFEGFLFDQLRNKNGWCYGIYAYQFPPSNKKGLIGYYSDPSDSTSSLLVPQLLQLLSSFGSHADFTQRLAERNSTFKNRYAYQQDLSYKIMSKISRDRYGIPILKKEEYFAEIDTVTESVSQKVIPEIFDHTNLTMVFYGDSKRISNIISSFDSSIPIEVHEKTKLID